ncbi:MAG: FAD-binding protein [Deltaproteobacteria bacterium]|nr:FAD-binding protein [Deltaproteobacteria bacterium]
MTGQATAASGNWDHEVDLLVVGSGAGAMVAAMAAHDGGASTLIIEKTDEYGGNSAMSGGAMWIPCSSVMKKEGVADSREEALTYLEAVTGGVVAREKMETYIDRAPEMLDWLHENTHLRMECMLTYPDYYADAPGGKPGGRSLEPEHFDARRLGDEFYRLREPAVQELVFGRMSMTATEAHHILARHKGWISLTMKMMGRYYADLKGRLRGKRDRCLSLGNALVAPLRMSVMDRDIELWLNTAMTELLVEEGRVVGIVAEREGRTLRLRGRQGVLLAAGGFERNQEMRDRFLPSPSKVEWTTGAPGSTGDAIELGEKQGAALDLMEHAWWGPCTAVPGEWNARMLVIEKGLPHTIMVNRAGKRFVNEASPYLDVVNAMYEQHLSGNDCVPAFMVFDSQYRSKYPCGPFLQSTQQPDWTLPARLRDGYLYKGDTVEELAENVGVDPAGLASTVSAFNDNAKRGVDPDFNRGDGLFDKFYGDEKVTPNPCLGALDKAPFYAIRAEAGELGTKGGLATDIHARVLREDGSPIDGLFAVGNNSASVMGTSYPGAGATIGPACTFGWLVGRDAAQRVVQGEAQGEAA